MTKEAPIACDTCGHVDWKNPIPVVVILRPVYDKPNDRVGLAMARRACSPHIGQWALCAGHVDEGECLEQAVRREWFEETGLSLEAPIEYLNSYAVAGNRVLAAFEVFGRFSLEEYAAAILCSENLEFGVCWTKEDAEELCFPLHRDLAKQWFDR